ncbi:MAG: FecCD family ABC transporter permease [Roseburia sp.]
MQNKGKALILLGIAALALILGIGIGSVLIPPSDILQILISFFTGRSLPQEVDPIFWGLVTGIRLPRVLMAFLAGAALSASGTIMQSVLKNPLASSYGLGVSSGAGLGAAIVIIAGIPAGWLGSFLLPLAGTAVGFTAVVLAMAFAHRIDRSLSDHTIILSGMVFSLFLNAILNTLATSRSKYTHQILLWQLGTFSGRDWSSIAILSIVVLLCMLLFQTHSRELDIMTFGEEQALTMGVNLKKEKWLLIAATSFLTGSAVSFVGVIGFVDLIAPHVVRKFFGSSHKWVLPMSTLFGGAFMVICDLVGRTLFSPSEIPTGSITALIGAPFFLYLFLRSRKKHP